jgi:hypothetical protein
MSGALYTLYVLKDPFDRMVPSLIFGLLLVCRLIILYQVNRREQQMYKEELERHKRSESAEDNKKAN